MRATRMRQATVVMAFPPPLHAWSTTFIGPCGQKSPLRFTRRPFGHTISRLAGVRVAGRIGQRHHHRRLTLMKRTLPRFLVFFAVGAFVA
jgi:hypothetical protein